MSPLPCIFVYSMILISVMHKTNFILLFVFLLIISCKSDKDPATPDPNNILINNDLTGYYNGYKTVNKSTTDSVSVSIKVEKNTETKFTITEITPFAHTLSIDMSGLNFIYDRGIGEKDCGATRMTGNGYFKGRSLYFIETTKCVKTNAPDEYVEYRVSKK